MATFTIGKGTAADLEALEKAVSEEMQKRCGMKPAMIALMQVEDAISNVQRLVESVKDTAETISRRAAKIAENAASSAWDVDSSNVTGGANDLLREIAQLDAARVLRRRDQQARRPAPLRPQGRQARAAPLAARRGVTRARGAAASTSPRPSRVERHRVVRGRAPDAGSSPASTPIDPSEPASRQERPR